MIDLNQLLTYLQTQGSPLTLSAQNVSLPSEMRQFLTHMPNGQVTLIPGDLSVHNDLLTLSGTSADSWPVQGMADAAIALANIVLTVTSAPLFTGVASGSLALSSTVSAAVTAEYVLADSPAWKIRLEASAAGVTPAMMLDFGALSPLPFSIPPQIGSLLGQAVTAVPSAFAVTFYPGTDFSPYYTFGLNAPAASWTLIPSVLAFNGIDLYAVLLKNSVSVILAGHVTVGASGNVDVGVSMGDGEHWMAFVRPPLGESWPGVTALASWIGGGTLGTQTEQGFSSVGFSTSAFDLQLSGVQLGFDWKTLSLDYLKIDSVLTVAGLPLDLTVLLPDLDIKGALHEGQPVKVVDMLSACSLPTEGVPASIAISAVDFSALLRRSLYSLGVTVKDVWQAGPVDLKEVSVSIAYSAEEGFSGGFAATLKIDTGAAPLEFELEAGYENAESGWVFSGTTAPGSQISIGAFIKALAKRFGIASVPKPIESLSLTSLSLSYETGSGAFAFACEGEFTISDQPVQMFVDVTVTQKAGAYTAAFTGRLVVGSLQFDLVFSTQSGGPDVFIADYINTDPKSSSLSDLAAAISSSAAKSIPKDLKIDLREVKLVYLNQKTSQWAFGLGLGLEISLADIPGIGSKLPPELNLGIQDLQILYCSQAFSQDQTALINPLLPKGVRPLPAEGTAASVTFGGGVRLGEKVIPLSFSVPPAASSMALTAASEAGSARGDIAEPAADPVHWVPINKQFGIFQFDRIGAEYQDNVLSFVLDAGISVGPIVFNVIGLSVGSPLDEFSPVFDLSGLALSLTLPSLTLGGAFLKVNHEFYGEATLQAATFGFKVLGGWSPSYTDLKGKEHPSSFFLYANINVPLGGPPFFFVTGLAGGFGVNRRLLLPTIEELPGYILLPTNAPTAEETPIKTIQKVLPALQHVFAEQDGQYWFAAGVQFTSFEMINAFVLVTVAFGVDLEIGILGSCAMTLPPGPYPAAYLEILLSASFSAKTGLLAVSGVLSPASFVYAGFVKIGGGFAFYTWLSGDHKGDFVVSMGGYAPGFTRPAHYPVVPRLSMSMGLGPFQVLGEAYFALTPGMLMAGLHLQATWTSGPIKVWLYAGLDFLIAWAPFHYEATVYIVLGASVDLGLFTIHVQVGANLQVWGPEFGGMAEVDLDVVKFTIAFGAKPTSTVPLGWAAFSEKFLPKPPSAKSGARALSLSGLPDPNPNIIKATAASGLLRIVGDCWVLDADSFSLETNSVVPANFADWNPGSLPAFVLPNDPAQYSPEGRQAPNGMFLQSPPKVMDKDHVWNPRVDIAPMHQTDVRSQFDITLLRRTDQGNDEYVFDVRVEPLLLNSASALWGENKADKQPNDPIHVPFTLVGFRISPPIYHPSQVNDVPLIELLFQQGFGTGFAYQSAQVDPNYTVTSQIVGSALNITVMTGAGQTISLPNQNYFLSSLIDPWVTSQRKSVLDDLQTNGFSTYAASEVNPSQFAANQALTDWPIVEMIGQ